MQMLPAHAMLAFGAGPSRTGPPQNRTGPPQDTTGPLQDSHFQSKNGSKDTNGSSAGHEAGLSSPASEAGPSESPDGGEQVVSARGGETHKQAAERSETPEAARGGGSRRDGERCWFCSAEQGGSWVNGARIPAGYAWKPSSLFLSNLISLLIEAPLLVKLNLASNKSPSFDQIPSSF